MSDSSKMFLEYLREAGYYRNTNTKEDYNFIKSNSDSETETNLILNSAVLLKIVNVEFNIEVSKSTFPEDWMDKEDDLVPSC